MNDKFDRTLLGLTTISGSAWKAKIKEIDKLKLRKIALFPTMLGLEKRKELYSLLEKTKLKEMPHVHLRDDMETWELDYFVDRYKTKVFNIHPRPTAVKFLQENAKYKNKIYVENHEMLKDNFNKILKMCAGICLDVSHWHDGKLLKWEGYDMFQSLIENNTIGCCHISAIRNKPYVEKYVEDRDKKKIFLYSAHYAKDLDEFSYIKDYIKYLPKIISIELENPLEEQIKVKEHIGKLLNYYKKQYGDEK